MQVVRGLALLGALAALGCTAKAHLIPVSGQGGEGTAVELAEARFDFAGLGRAGTLEVRTATGRVLTGPYRFMDPGDASSLARSRELEVKYHLPEGWDAIYGASYFTGQVLGGVRCVAELSGDDGRHVVLDMVRIAPRRTGSEFRGIARDDRGSLYKVVL
jgi:hypothetical protein